MGHIYQGQIAAEANPFQVSPSLHSRVLAELPWSPVQQVEVLPWVRLAAVVVTARVHPTCLEGNQPGYTNQHSWSTARGPNMHTCWRAPATDNWSGQAEGLRPRLGAPGQDLCRHLGPFRGITRLDTLGTTYTVEQKVDPS